MAEELVLSEGDRAEQYRVLLPQIKSLIEDEVDLIANLANIAAALHQMFGFLWVGFYRVIDTHLVLGPFQGPIACTRIVLPNGVCGACVQQKTTLVVPDVDKFPGHIACSSKSKSEIVVPLLQNGEVKLVLDIDSEMLNDFSEIDKRALEELMTFLEKKYPAPNPLLQMPRV